MVFRPYPRTLPVKPASKYKKNEEIQAFEIRVIDDLGENLGLMEKGKAITLAKEKNLDLVEIAKTPKETIAKIVNFSKFVYQKEKEEKKQKEKQGKNEIKNIQLRLGIQAHDMETKARQAEKFLNLGHNVQISMFLRGRERGKQTEALQKIKEFITFIKVAVKPIGERQGPRGPQMIVTKIATNK